MRKTCATPPTGESLPTAWPSGESLASFVGLFTWLICVIFAGPLGVFAWGQKRYAKKAAARSATQAATRIYFVRAGFTEDWTATAEAELLAVSGARPRTAPLPDDEIRPESVSRRRRFRSVRISEAC